MTALLAALAGCPVGGEPPSGADAGGYGSDGGLSGTAIGFAFHSVPDHLPAGLPEAPAVELESARFDLSQVRAFGDNATGEGTTLDSLKLEWKEDENEPYYIEFPRAPVSMYSWLKASVDRYRLRGAVDIDGDRVEFDLDDRVSESLTVSASLNAVELRAGETEVVDIEVVLGRLLSDVPWATLPRNEDGKISIGDDDDDDDDAEEVIEQIRRAIETSFRHRL